jgi:hypothetical protein
MPESQLAVAVSVSRKVSRENGKHLQKTMQILTKCDVAVAQASVSFFYLLTGMFLIAFVEKLMP